MPANIGVGSHARIITNYGVVDPSDTISFPEEVAGVWVGGAGNVAFVKRNEEVVVFAAVPAGTFMPVACTRVNLTNTTATLMVWVI